ncbi:LytTR family DNA-binding domain-containing protein [Ascidiimonas aurantiaca]|uniref:LytTR family DNA-binding domain-containing protein n=1 Tax=Ascidiimonas aurantiaca TaxID=1685432 RepID=UPI0030ED9647
MSKKVLSVLLVTLLISVFLYGLIDPYFFYFSEWNTDKVVNFLHLWFTLITGYLLFNYLLLKAFRRYTLKKYFQWLILLLIVSAVVFGYVLVTDILFYKLYYNVSSLREETTLYDYDLPIIGAMLIIGSTYFYQKYFYKPVAQDIAEPETVSKYLKEIRLQTGNETRLVSIIEVALFYTDQGLVWARLHNGESFHTSYTLAALTDTLNPHQFFRLNRQVIVARKAIAAFKKLDYQKLEIQLQYGMNFHKNLIVSKYNAPVFKKWITQSL